MAVPGGQSAIWVGVTPSSDASLNVELWRKTTDAGSTYVLLATLKGASIVGGYTYRDYLPASTRTYTYRARNVAAGFTAGAWWPPVSGNPTIP
jgi:hypothetical protein